MTENEQGFKKIADLIEGANVLKEIEKFDEEVILSLVCTLIDDLAERKGVKPETLAAAIGEIIKGVKEEFGEIL